MIEKTCAVVVTYNRLELLKECLGALEKQTEPVNHIIIIDNDSSDGTMSYLNSLNDKRYIIFHSDKNLGGAGGFSKGIEIAFTETDDDSFWLMDDDTIVNENCNNVLTSVWTKYEKEISFLISNVRWTNGDPANVMNVTADWPKMIDEGLVEVKHGSFVSFSVSRNQVEKYGLPIGEMFIWGDDTEYSRRLSTENPGYFVIDAIATHNSKSNNIASGLDKDVVDRISRYFYLYRNSMYTKRIYDGKKGIFEDLISGLKMGIKIIVHSNKRKGKRIWVLMHGILSGLFFTPVIKTMHRNN